MPNGAKDALDTAVLDQQIVAAEDEKKAAGRKVRRLKRLRKEAPVILAALSGEVSAEGEED